MRRPGAAGLPSEVSWRVCTNGTALVQDAPARGFYTDYARSAARQGLLRLFFLRLDSRVVAGSKADRTRSQAVSAAVAWSQSCSA